MLKDEILHVSYLHFFIIIPLAVAMTTIWGGDSTIMTTVALATCYLKIQKGNIASMVG